MMVNILITVDKYHKNIRDSIYLQENMNILTDNSYVGITNALASIVWPFNLLA